MGRRKRRHYGHGKTVLLDPFICGLCKSEFNNISKFYDHFHKHAEILSGSYFHACDWEETGSFDRDGVESSGFQCTCCQTMFPSLCMIHDHYSRNSDISSFLINMKTQTCQPDTQTCTKLIASKKIKLKTITNRNIISNDAKKGVKITSQENQTESSLKLMASRSKPVVVLEPLDISVTGKNRGAKKKMTNKRCVTTRTRVQNMKLNQQDEDILDYDDESDSDDEIVAKSGGDDDDDDSSDNEEDYVENTGDYDDDDSMEEENDLDHHLKLECHPDDCLDDNSTHERHLQETNKASTSGEKNEELNTKIKTDSMKQKKEKKQKCIRKPVKEVPVNEVTQSNRTFLEGLPIFMDEKRVYGYKRKSTRQRKKSALEKLVEQSFVKLDEYTDRVQRRMDIKTEDSKTQINDTISAEQKNETGFWFVDEDGLVRSRKRRKTAPKKLKVDFDPDEAIEDESIYFLKNVDNKRKSDKRKVVTSNRPKRSSTKLNESAKDSLEVDNDKDDQTTDKDEIEQAEGQRSDDDESSDAEITDDSDEMTEDVDEVEDDLPVTDAEVDTEKGPTKVLTPNGKDEKGKETNASDKNAIIEGTCSTNMQRNEHDRPLKQGTGKYGNYGKDSDEEHEWDEERPPKRIKKQKKKEFLQCDLCKMFVRKYSMPHHLEVHNTDRGRKIYSPENLTACEKCGRVVFKNGMRVHRCNIIGLTMLPEPEPEPEPEVKVEPPKKKEKFNPKKIVCDICGDLLEKYKMRDHIAIKHCDEKPFACELCGLRFKTIGQLRNHKDNHHPLKEFQCNKCPMKFATTSRLNKHSIRHSKDRPYACDLCGQTFKISKNKSRHMILIHTEGEQHVCGQCGKMFKWKKQLNNHIASVHERSTRWACIWPECDVQVTSSASIKRHMIIHTGEKPVKCTRCAAAFRQFIELHNHNKRVHGITQFPGGGWKQHDSVDESVIYELPATGDGVKRKTFAFLPEIMEKQGIPVPSTVFRKIYADYEQAGPESSTSMSMNEDWRNTASHTDVNVSANETVPWTDNSESLPGTKIPTSNEAMLNATDAPLYLGTGNLSASSESQYMNTGSYESMQSVSDVAGVKVELPGQFSMSGDQREETTPNISSSISEAMNFDF